MWLAQVDDGRLSVQNGAPAIRHMARSKAQNNKIQKAKRDYPVTLVTENYQDFGPTFVAEIGPVAV